MSLISIKYRLYKSFGRHSVYKSLINEYITKATNEYNDSIKEYEDVFKTHPSLMFKLSRKYRYYTGKIKKYEYLIRMEEQLRDNLIKRIEMAEYSNSINNKKFYDT